MRLLARNHPGLLSLCKRFVLGGKVALGLSLTAVARKLGSVRYQDIVATDTRSEPIHRTGQL